MAGTKEGAYLAVAGLPFGKPPTEESLDRHGEPSARVIADKLGIAKEHQVLEVGVGVGRLAKHIAARCAKFTGIDISHKMIAITSERLRQLPNVTLIAHEKSDLSIFQNNSFDRAYFQTVLIHLDREDVFNYLRETYRVLRPGGLAWFHFYNLLHPKGFAEFRYAADYAVQHGGKLRGRVQCVTAPEVRRLVKEAGLQIRDDLSHLELERQNFGFEIPDSDWEYYLIAIAEKQQEG
jgi:ubiquinone/menaquinone biosynthesis C-methylase UbiE